MDGHEFHCAEFTIDPTDKFIDHGAEILIFLNILSTRYSNLDEDYLSDPFRMIGEEYFKGVQFLGDTFDVIQSVDTHDEFDASKLLLEYSNTFLYFWEFESVDKLLGVNSNGKGGYSDELPPKFDSVWCGWSFSVVNISGGLILVFVNLQYSGATTQEMPGIVVGMEADQVAM